MNWNVIVGDGARTITSCAVLTGSVFCEAAGQNSKMNQKFLNSGSAASGY